MNIWTIKEGEPLPIPECPGRRMRTGIISEMLAERGHDVTWWTSDFFHQQKKRLRNEETVVEIRNNYRLHMLHAKTVYKKSISLQRFLYSRQLGNEFKRVANNAAKPDVIVCSFPLIDFAYHAVKYAKQHHVPIIIDVRDLWPNIFWERFSKALHGVIKFLNFEQRKRTEYVMQNADVVIGVIPKCLTLAETYGRKLGRLDEVYYLGYQEKNLTQEEMDKAMAFWQNFGLTADDFIICYMGQVNRKGVDIETVAEVVKELPFCKFVVCGDGDARLQLERKYKQYNNIMFTGFINQEELIVLMEMASVGINPIISVEFTDAINNKAIEYMAGSLCIGSVLKGLLKDIIIKNELGFYYENKEELKDNLIQLHNTPELLQKNKTNARHYFEKCFKGEVIYGKYCDLIEGL